MSQHAGNKLTKWTSPKRDHKHLLLLIAGTNFLIRANAFKQAGWSPEYTLTEDYMLGMVLKQHKWHCRYVEEYLAVGEAPEQVRNCFQQRSRWCKVSHSHNERSVMNLPETIDQKPKTGNSSKASLLCS